MAEKEYIERNALKNDGHSCWHDGKGRNRTMFNNIRYYIREVIWEWKWLKQKPCAACKHFDYYMGSAGVCTAKSGCPAKRMKDYSDVCDCNRFKKRKKRKRL